MKFFQEFKEFALKGSVLDMAIGIVIGGAFQSIRGRTVRPCRSMPRRTAVSAVRQAGRDSTSAWRPASP